MSVVAFTACLVLYPFARPAWERAVVASADVALHVLRPPMRLEINPAGYWHAWRLEPGGDETFVWGRPPKNLHLFFVGLALLPALLAATPVPIARRLRLVATGLLLLFVAHVLAATALVHAQHHLRLVDPESLFWDWVKTIANTFGQVISFVLWALLTWDVWLGLVTGRGAPRTDAPVPDGRSGTGDGTPAGDPTPSP